MQGYFEESKSFAVGTHLAKVVRVGKNQRIDCTTLSFLVC